MNSTPCCHVLQAKTGAGQSRSLSLLLVLIGKGFFKGIEDIQETPCELSLQTESAQLFSQIINIPILLEIILAALPEVRSLLSFFFFLLTINT